MEFRRGCNGAQSGLRCCEVAGTAHTTPQLLDFLRTLSPDAFKSSALQLHQGGSAEAAAELSDWQQRHAVLVLARAKELWLRSAMICARAT